MFSITLLLILFLFFLSISSITSKQSLEELIPTYREIVEVKAGEENLPIMLVGNKCDEESTREVNTEYANEMVAKILKGCGFIETSAKNGTNVHEAFQVLKDFPQPPVLSKYPKHTHF